MLEIDNVYHGFRLKRQEHIQEIESDALLFCHEKTKAETLILQNEDDNKVFMISFRTPPDSDNGVAHILEHSVLNGSSKYPVKEPFAELLKCSLNTFLNAMTYPDRTVYPVASRNDQDFHNLVDVYLDAVFNPTLSRYTFLQEGWHYELASLDAPLGISGVVYNEMLGSYSDPENVLISELDKLLFADSIYGHSSGGDPVAIPDLTFDDFVGFHLRFYHPSNSRVFIGGNVDVDAQLQHLAGYLAPFSYREVDSSISRQPRYQAPRQKTAHYPIAEGESSERKTYALRGYLLGSSTDPEAYLAMSILSRILNGTPASPLRKALVDSQLGDSTLNYGFENDILDTYYSIGLKGTEPDRVPEMEAIIDKTLSDLAENGINKKMVEASVNTVEFHLREANFGGYPKALYYSLLTANSWNYDADPLMHLRYETHLSAVKEKIAEGDFFEQMIREQLVDNPHHATVTLVPDAQLEAKRQQTLRERLSAHKATLSPEAQQQIIDDNAERERLQRQPDTPEALATIPVLSLDCIKREAEPLTFQILGFDGKGKMSLSEQPTNGIAYVTLGFNADRVPLELIPYLPLFGQITQQTGTKQRDYVDLTQEIGIHTGGISSTYSCSAVRGFPDQVNSRLVYHAKALSDKIPRLFSILDELISECLLDNVERIRQLVRIARSGMQSQIVPSGHSFAAKRLAAYHSEVGRYAELTGGLSQYYFLEQVAAELEQEPEKVCERLRALHLCLFRQESAHLHVTGSPTEAERCRTGFAQVLSRLPEKAATKVTHEMPAFEPNEAWIMPATIQYVGKGANFYDWGYQYRGSFEVLDTLLSREYLWNQVRVLGNAYGCFMNLDFLTGNFACMSYRDPNLDNTYAAYDGIADYLESLSCSDAEFEKLIIGTIGTLDMPKTASQKGAIALNRHLCRVTADEVQQRREEILDCRKEHLAEYVPLFRRFADEGSLCVFGGGDAIKDSETTFGQVRLVFRDAE